MKKTKQIKEKTYLPPLPQVEKSTYRLATWDAIPLVILIIIQQYVSEVDYRHLLNTNLTIFRQVKYETASFHFKGLNKKGFSNLEAKKNYFLQLINDNIQNRHQQLSFTIYDLTETLARQYQAFFSDLLCLHFRRNLKADISLSYFHHIYKIIFHEFGKQRTRLEGLQYITILEINYAPTLTYIGFIPTLKRLVLNSCNSLRDLSMYFEIEELLLSNCKVLQLPPTFGPKQKIIKLTGLPAIDDESLMQPFQQASYLSLWGPFRPELLPLRGECLIYTTIRQPILTEPLHFRYLRLNGFKCLWQQSLSNLQMGVFHHCFFPDLLSLIHVPHLVFFHCTGSLDFSLLQGTKELVINNIRSFTDMRMVRQIKVLTVRQCGDISEIHISEQMKVLSILSCPKIQSLDGLMFHQLEEVTISDQPQIQNFTQLKNIKKVTIDRCPGLTNLQDFINVRLLTIIDCQGLVDIATPTTSQNPLNSLTLILCQNVVSFAGVQLVKYLRMEGCPRLEGMLALPDRESLESVVIRGCPLLEQELQTQAGKEWIRSIPYLRILKEHPTPLLYNMNLFPMDTFPDFFKASF